ncbi:MAG: hypothetical protein WAM30_01445, partial [Candidatus Dormiibacterota bacterium]
RSFMRSRFTVLATACTAFTLAAVPGIAGAAPQQNLGLTIHAVPHRIIAGEAVLLYGRLTGAGHGNQTIRLYHRINPARQFTLISTTKTDAAGGYEFTRAEGVVQSNRSWFVRGPAFSHSRTVHERVAALVSLATSSTPAVGQTRHPIVFSGHVTPGHAGSVVVLQAQKGSSDDWTTLKRGVVQAGSNYQISFAWRTPGERDVRVLFRGDARNTAAASDPVTVVVQQTEHSDFTISTSAPIVVNGAPFTISGTLYQPGTTTPEPSTSVSLFAREPGGPGFHELTTATTGSDGSYSFPNLTSTINELYQVRATFPPARDNSSVVFEGVQDVLSMTSSSSTSTVNGHITFSGSVSPDKAGHVIYLQKFGKDGDWHTVEVRSVKSDSTYTFGWTFGTAGVKEFRARITGGPANVGNASAPVTIDVTQPPLSSLPNT